MILEPGQTIERYDVVELLGQGGMAAVYLVRHRTLGSLHALKVLTSHHAAVRERLLTEGRAQAQLHHPNVLAVTDVVEIRGAPGLLLEYVPGPPMDEWLTGDLLPLADVLTVFAGILRGVERAHDAGFVHRDLKPANVLLDVTESGLVPKVADFGIVKALGAQGRATRRGATMGSAPYMAPEQILDASSVDRRADIWSLGAMLYELVCGRRAFGGDDVLEVMRVVTHGVYQQPDVYVEGLPDSLLDVIDGCLQVDRAERIQSCGALRERLGDLLPVDERLALHSVGGLRASAARKVTSVSAEQLPMLQSKPPGAEDATFGLDDLGGETFGLTSSEGLLAAESPPSSGDADRSTLLTDPVRRNEADTLPLNVQDLPDGAPSPPDLFSNPGPQESSGRALRGVLMGVGTFLLTIGGVLLAIGVVSLGFVLVTPPAAEPEDVATAPVEPPMLPETRGPVGAAVPDSVPTVEPARVKGPPVPQIPAPVPRSSPPPVTKPRVPPAPPAPAPAEDPPAVETIAAAPAGRLVVEGEQSTRVRLVSGSVVHPVDKPVPAGSYTLELYVADAWRNSGSVVITEGATTRVRCSVAMGQCVPM